MLMKKITFLFILINSILISAQIENNYLKIIDSINQNNWKQKELDLDSLANPVFVPIERDFQDTIFVADEIIFVETHEEIPVTPFSLINYKEGKKWYFFGQNNLVFNQASFKNWNSGGNDNIGVIGKVNYNLSYRNRKHYLENILQLGYGWIASEGQSSRKTEDYINLMSNYGYELGKNYYLSTGFQFLTQFSPGFNYAETPDPSYSDRISKFMAPGYLNAGLGISYNPNENFQVIFRPANGKFTFVTDPHLQQAGKYGLEEDGQSMRTELGALLNIIYRLKVMKDVTFDHQLNFFSNYITHSERVDIGYTGVLNIKFNKFITTVVSLDLAYDHDQIKDLQRKQTLGVGFSYNFGAQNKEEKKNKKSIKPFITK